MQGHKAKTKQKHFSTQLKGFMVIYSNTAIDLYILHVYSLEYKKCYNILVGKEKYIYIVQQVRSDFLLCL